MSTYLSTQTMVTQLQKRVPLGISSTDAMFYLNQAYWKLLQFSKGGFVWELKNTVLLTLVGSTDLACPADFDPGKSAWLSHAFPDQKPTLVPFMPYSEFTVQEKFSSPISGVFSAWTLLPNFTYTTPTSYAWGIRLAPASAAVGVQVPFNFIYHTSLPVLGLTSGATIYFPTPPQFDPMILDLAEAEVKRVYNVTNWDRIAQQATQGIMEMIDTYRSDRYDLSGLTDQMAQAQEKQMAKDK